MHQMANIVVKNAANQDVTYTALTPSAGDQTLATWRALGSAVPLMAPALSVKTTYNQARNARRVTINGVFPVVSSVGGVDTVTAKRPFTLETTVPLNISVAAATDQATIMANLFKNALLQEILSDGYNAV